MKKFILSLLILFCFMTVNAQQHKNLQRGDAYFDIGHYYNAIKYYKTCIRKSNEGYVLSQLMICYSKINEPENVVKAFQRLIKLKNTISEESKLEYASALLKLRMYKECRQFIEQDKYLTNPAFTQIKLATDSVRKWNQIGYTKYNVSNVMEVNSSYSDISPCIFKKNLVFASNREDFIIKNRPGGDELPFYDLFIANAKNDDQSEFFNPKLFSSIINTGTHESSVSFSSDGQKVFFAQHIDQNDSAMNPISRIKLFYMEKNKNRWENPHSFVFNDSCYSFTHPYLTKKGNLFFFVSDMKGGIGGTDIYFCSYDSTKGWSNPINVGAPVNTLGNEIYPSYDESSNMLYFSSDFHTGYGGYDIFMAELIDNENINVINMRSPINSSYDDLGFIFYNKKLGYFSSNRPEGKGKEDIYRFYSK